MKLPNKVTPYQGSIFPKAIKLFKSIEKNSPVTVVQLKSLNSKYLTTSEFIEALDLLFITGKIALHDSKVVLQNAEIY